MGAKIQNKIFEKFKNHIRWLQKIREKSSKRSGEADDLKYVVARF